MRSGCSRSMKCSSLPSHARCFSATLCISLLCLFLHLASFSSTDCKQSRSMVGKTWSRVCPRPCIRLPSQEVPPHTLSVSVPKFGQLRGAHTAVFRKSRLISRVLKVRWRMDEPRSGLQFDDKIDADCLKEFPHGWYWMMWL